MRQRFIPIAMALIVVLVASGCSSTDPTTSDEYGELEQRLTEVEAQLADMTDERDALVAEAWSSSGDQEDSLIAPGDITEVLDDWGEAVNSGDGSVIELYTAAGYHLYGTRRIGHDDIASHLDAQGVTGEWTTEPYVLVDNGAGRYVVTRGARNTTTGGQVFDGSLTFVIKTANDGDMQIVNTAWSSLTG